MLISDTGGGHRASAQAMEAMLDRLRPGGLDVDIVDVFTKYCPWPYNSFVPSYQVMAKNPWMWQATWHLTALAPVMVVLDALSRLACQSAFTQCIREHRPELVVSLHPLTQYLPLLVLDELADGEQRTVPFATVVTDLGSAHPWWFSDRVDRCFVPSDAVRAVGEARGLRASQLSQYGLPVRPSFWDATRPKAELCAELGLDAERQIVLVVGGGDGVGGLSDIVDAAAVELGRECAGCAQLVAVCGKNEALRALLESKRWTDVDVQVRDAFQGGRLPSPKLGRGPDLDSLPHRSSFAIPTVSVGQVPHA